MQEIYHIDIFRGWIWLLNLFMRKSNSKNRYSKHIKGKGDQFISGSEISIFDRKQILEKQNKLRKLYEGLKNNHEVQYYGKIKYQQIIYQIGQFIEIFSINFNDFYIARLTNIIKIPYALEPRAFIEIAWVLKKNDLPEHILAKYGEYISTAELFPSSEKIYLYIQSIKNKCTVLTIEEYGQLGLTNQVIFFSRSDYDQVNKRLTSDPETWKADCECRKPNNPDLKYIQCSRCSQWFHEDCVQSKIINNCFLCDRCLCGRNSSQIRSMPLQNQKENDQ